MKLKAFFPTRDIGTDPAKIHDWAQAAEDLGFAMIEVPDHVFGATTRDGWQPLYNEKDPFHETFVTLGFSSTEFDGTPGLWSVGTIGGSRIPRASPPWRERSAVAPKTPLFDVPGGALCSRNSSSPSSQSYARKHRRASARSMRSSSTAIASMRGSTARTFAC
jgi:hypothetical protein